MTDTELWKADMKAWGLTQSQRVHHLWRLHDYHRRVHDRHLAKAARLDRIQAITAVVFLAAITVGLLL